MNFDPELLRTLVAFADTGTLSRTAEIIGRTPSAVTAQIKRLEAPWPGYPCSNLSGVTGF